MRQSVSTTRRPYASVIYQIPKFAKAMLIYTNSMDPIFVIRNNEIPTIVTPCFLNRQIKPNTRLFSVQSIRIR